MDWAVVVEFCEIPKRLVLRLLRSVVTEVRVRRSGGRGRRRGGRSRDAGDDLGRNAGGQRLIRVMQYGLLLLLLLCLLVVEISLSQRQRFRVLRLRLRLRLRSLTLLAETLFGV